jgi:hypothetical protein
MDRRRAAALWAAFAVVVVLLARGLPQRTFAVGDPGLKLIAARNAIAHPARPFDIDLPRVGGRPVDLLDPSFSIHGDHAHAATSELFPLMSAPFIAWFGISGAYVLPALGFLLALAATAWAGLALDGRRSPTMLVLTAAACTPLLFYGLEFWEHAPAVGVAALATAIFVRKRSVPALLACGFLLGATVLLRPEAAWYCVGLFIGAWWLPSRPTVRHLAAALAGMAIVWAPAAVGAFMHSGQLLGGHVARNMTGLSDNWWWDRVQTLHTWLAPSWMAWTAVCLLLLALGIATKARPAARSAVAIAGAIFVAVAAVAAARGEFAQASVWNAAPAALLMFATPRLGARQGGRFLAAVAVTCSLLVLLTAPNDGGSQWGPRYLLFTFIPVSILTSDALTAIARRPRVVGIVVVVLVVASSLVVQRSAFKNLRGAKQAYARLLDSVERGTSPGGYIVTDLWWLQQVTAALYPTRTVLFVDGSASARRALALLAGESAVTVVRSDRESSPDSLDSWLDGAPFVVERQTASAERTLILSRLAPKGSGLIIER